MKWKIEELKTFLTEDPAIRIMFVEGITDLTFWRQIVPTSERTNSQVYCISDVYIPDEVGGERGRMQALASMCSQWTHFDRLIFFVDADADRLIGNFQASNIVWTDGRDFESYALLKPITDILCEVGLITDVNAFYSRVEALVKPVGILRVVSERHSWQLPFQSSLKNGSLKRFFIKKKNAVSLNLDSLISSLLQRAGRMKEVSALKTDLSEEDKKCAFLPLEQVVHGKDLIALLAWQFAIETNAISGMLRLSIAGSLEFMRQQPSIKRCETWLRV